MRFSKKRRDRGRGGRVKERRHSFLNRWSTSPSPRGSSIPVRAAGATAPEKCLPGITRSVTKWSFVTTFVTKQPGELKAGLHAEVRGEAAWSPPPPKWTLSRTNVHRLWVLGNLPSALWISLFRKVRRSKVSVKLRSSNPYRADIQRFAKEGSRVAE